MYSESSQASKTEIFAKVINSLKPLTISTKSIILGVWMVFKYRVFGWFSIHEAPINNTFKIYKLFSVI